MVYKLTLMQGEKPFLLPSRAFQHAQYNTSSNNKKIGKAAGIWITKNA